MTVIDADRSPQGIARDLAALHGETEAAITVMRSLLAAPDYDEVRVPETRLRLSRGSMRRLQFLSAFAYPCAMEGASAAQQEAIRTLQVEATANRERSSAHVTKWSSAGIAADWKGFRRDAAAILTMMTERLHQERDVLLPMLMVRRA